MKRDKKTKIEYFVYNINKIYEKNTSRLMGEEKGLKNMLQRQEGKERMRALRENQ